MHQSTIETARKISQSFVNYPHLRLAVAALLLAGNDKALNAGDVDQFEAWIFVNPKVKEDLGNCRAFLSRLCPIRYSHTELSNSAEAVVALFPQADYLLKSLPPETKPEEHLRIEIDPKHYEVRGRRPGKRAIAIMRDAAEAMASVLQACQVDAAVVDAAREDHSYGPTPYSFYVGVLAQVSPAAVITLEASSHRESQLLARAVATKLDEAGLSVAPGEHGPFQLAEGFAYRRFLTVTLPFASGAEDEYAEYERAEIVAKAIFAGIVELQA